MPCERLDVRAVARITGHKVTFVRARMLDGSWDIGTAVKVGKKHFFDVYRAKFNRHMGRPLDYVWPEEEHGE